jgi:hypothetical protein
MAVGLQAADTYLLQVKFAGVGPGRGRDPSGTKTLHGRAWKCQPYGRQRALFDQGGRSFGLLLSIRLPLRQFPRLPLIGASFASVIGIPRLFHKNHCQRIAARLKFSIAPRIAARLYIPKVFTTSEVTT